MKYFYTGDLSSFSWAEVRRKILIKMGREVQGLDYISYLYVLGTKLGNLQNKLGIGPSIWKYNRDLLNAVVKYCPDVVWIDKGTLVQPSILRTIKQRTGAVIVNYNTDYFGCKKHYWRFHIPSLPEYDFYFTSNPLNVELLRRSGVKNVIVIPLGYDRDLFKPYQLTNEEIEKLGASVGFIGHWEPTTEDLILRLIELGLPLRVRGSSWHHARNKKRLAGTVESFRSISSGTEYLKSIIATKINLGINSAQNRNQSSGRSFEIPAAGGFLLAERTKEHQDLYEEGKEAEFFDSPEELVDKARYYLKHEQERKQIAENGHMHCISGGYSFQELMAKMVQTVEQGCRSKWGSSGTSSK